MKIALVQMQMSQDMELNYQKSLDYIRGASEEGAQLVMFPEIQLGKRELWNFQAIPS